jgi:hypothetical protein
MSESEVARLRQRIAEEYQAAQMGLTGLASGVSKHAFITARMERMGQSFEQLSELVGSRQEAMKEVVEALEETPEQADRRAILEQVRQQEGEGEQTELLITQIKAMWATVDQLRELYGWERARAMIEALKRVVSQSSQEEAS